MSNTESTENIRIYFITRDGGGATESKKCLKIVAIPLSNTRKTK